MYENNLPEKKNNHFFSFFYCSRVHITQSTLENLRGEYEVEPGNGHLRNEDIAALGIQTFFIVPPQRRKKTLLFNTLHVRNAMLPSGKRKPSFKMVSQFCKSAHCTARGPET